MIALLVLLLMLLAIGGGWLRCPIAGVRQFVPRPRPHAATWRRLAFARTVVATSWEGA